MYDPLCWPGAMSLDLSLLIHYPCSKDCIHSKALVKARLKYLKTYASTELLTKILRAHSIGYTLENGRIISQKDAQNTPSDKFVYPAYTLSLNTFLYDNF